MNTEIYYNYVNGKAEPVSQDMLAEQSPQKQYTCFKKYGDDIYYNLETGYIADILDYLELVALSDGTLCPQDKAVWIERDEVFIPLREAVGRECHGGPFGGETIYTPTPANISGRSTIQSYAPNDSYFYARGDFWHYETYTACSNCASIINMDHESVDDDGNCESCSNYNDEDGDEFYFNYKAEDKIELPYTRLFGVELETDTRREVLCDSNNRDFIKSEEDGSIEGYEHVSRKLQGPVDLANLKRFCEEATDDDLSVDSQCGYHLHLDASDFTLKNFNNLLSLYTKFEPVFYRMLPASRLVGSWCKPLAYRPLEKAISLPDLESKFYGTKDKYQKLQAKSQKSSEHRYMGLNLHSYFYRQQEFGRGSVELRYHSGTMDSEKVLNWIYIHQFMFDLAHKGSPRVIKVITESVESKELLLKDLIRKKSLYSDELKETLCNYIDKRMTKFKPEHELHKYSKDRWFYLDESKFVQKKEADDEKGKQVLRAIYQHVNIGDDYNTFPISNHPQTAPANASSEALTREDVDRAVALLRSESQLTREEA